MHCLDGARLVDRTSSPSAEPVMATISPLLVAISAGRRSAKRRNRRDPGECSNAGEQGLPGSRLSRCTRHLPLYFSDCGHTVGVGPGSPPPPSRRSTSNRVATWAGARNLSIGSTDALTVPTSTHTSVARWISREGRACQPLGGAQRSFSAGCFLLIVSRRCSVKWAGICLAR